MFHRTTKTDRRQLGVNEKRIFKGIPLRNGNWYEKNKQNGYIPIEDVQELICENQSLREELFTRESEDTNNVHHLYNNILGTSTTNVVQKVERISREWNISVPAIFNMMYKTLGVILNLNLLDEKNNKTSKLRRLWMAGLLPFASLYVLIFSSLMHMLRSNLSLNTFQLVQKELKENTKYSGKLDKF